MSTFYLDHRAFRGWRASENSILEDLPVGKWRLTSPADGIIEATCPNYPTRQYRDGKLLDSQPVIP